MYERQPKNASEFAGFKRVSWGAIFAGTAAALMGYLVLNLLGLGIGLGSFNVGRPTRRRRRAWASGPPSGWPSS